MDHALATTRLIAAALNVVSLLDRQTLDRVDDGILRTRLEQLEQHAKNYQQAIKPRPRPNDLGTDDFDPLHGCS